MVCQTIANWKWDAEYKRGLTPRALARASDLLKVRVEIDGCWLFCDLVSLKVPKALPGLGVKRGWHLGLVLPHSTRLVPACDWYAWDSEEESMSAAMQLWGISPKPVMSRDYRLSRPADLTVAMKGGVR